MIHPSEVFNAIRAGDRERLEEFLAQDPDLAGALDEQGVSAILVAQYWRQPDLVELLRAAKPKLDLFEAAALGDGERVAELLHRYPEAVRVYAPDGFTPLHLAAFFRHTGVVGFLLDRGADAEAEARNATSVRPLHSAVAGGEVTIVRLLLERGADPNVRQQGGWTPLMGAAANGHLEMVRLLLDGGADPKARSDDGRTAREMALERGQSEAAEILAAWAG